MLPQNDIRNLFDLYELSEKSFCFELVENQQEMM